MIAYADANYLVALFVTEQDAARRGWCRWQTAGLSRLLISRLTLNCSWFDHNLTDGNLWGARLGLNHARIKGLLVRREGPAHRLCPESHSFVTYHFRKAPSGTLDVLHVASALILLATAVLIFDKRQRDLASAAGLHTALVPK